MKPSMIISSLLVVGLLLSCDTKEKQHLLSKVDSLQVELQTSQQAAYALQDIGEMLDAIDESRQMLRTNVVEGTSYDNYKNRLNELNGYIVETQQKIADLESSLKKSASNYSVTIKRLKADLELNQQQLAALQGEVAKMRSENDMLVMTVREKDDAIEEHKGIIQMREHDIETLEARVVEVNKLSTESKAELYFAQAQALELAADRTKFAPKKKKETQREALELYRLSRSLGNLEAQEKIAELEKSLG